MSCLATPPSKDRTFHSIKERFINTTCVKQQVLNKQYT